MYWTYYAARLSVITTKSNWHAPANYEVLYHGQKIPAPDGYRDAGMTEKEDAVLTIGMTENRGSE